MSKYIQTTFWACSSVNKLCKQLKILWNTLVPNTYKCQTHWVMNFFAIPYFKILCTYNLPSLNSENASLLPFFKNVYDCKKFQYFKTC